MALLALTALSPLLYLGYTFFSIGYLGFPLDDAWIHQTYARNLVRYGQLAYNPGQPSAGSTAPLWTLLVSLGYLLGLDFKLWTYLLGVICLALTGWMAYRLSRRLFPHEEWVALLVGLFCALEWHLVWAALSGMETILFVFLSLLLMERYLAIHSWPPFGPSSLRLPALEGKRRACPYVALNGLQLGLIGGLLTLVRPEGVGLLGLIGLDTLGRWFLMAERPSIKEMALHSLAGVCGFALPLAPYLAFNLKATGLIFPNTFYAKQAEYRILLESLPFASRLWKVTKPTLVGPQALLLPGFLTAVYKLIRGKEFRGVLPLIWGIALLALYAWRLPVDYQHGRYLIPTIPILILYGVWGTLGLVNLSSKRFASRVLSRALLIAALAVLVVFWAILGPRAYAIDVGFIEGEMVTVAYWLREHTPRTALIAVHDIGAIGYYADRPLIDMAGLVTPEVIPFIRDEGRLLSFIEAKGADYLVTFPSWYPQMVEDPRLRPLYVSGYAWTIEAGEDNMVVYKTQWHAR